MSGCGGGGCGGGCGDGCAESKRKIAELELENSELREKLHSVMERAERRKANFKRFRANTSLSLSLVDPSDMTITQVNPAALRNLGREWTVVGLSFGKLIVESDRDRVLRQIVHCCEQQSDLEGIEFSLLRADGTVMLVNALFRHVQRYSHKTTIMCEVSFLNITGMRLARRELEAVRNALVGVTEEKQNLERVLCVLAHDIRSVASGMLGLIHINKEETVSLVPQLCNHGEMMMVVLNNMLAAMQPDGSIVLHTSQCDLRGLVISVASVFHANAVQKGLVLSTSVSDAIPRLVLIDGDRLRQVLMNLVGNAVKFTETGTVELVVGIENGNVFIEVKDTGPGIPVVDRERIFELYAQCGDEAQSSKGFGIGLSVVSTMVKAMGGAIAVNSVVDQGSTFIITLPLVLACGDNSGNPNSDTRLRVLVVDDDPDITELMRFRLNGHDVTTSQCPKDALELFKKNGFDLVITDCNMYTMTGFDLIDLMREHERDNNLSPITIVMVTAHQEESVKQKAIKYGADAVYQKPLRPDGFNAILRMASKKSSPS